MRCFSAERKTSQAAGIEDDDGCEAIPERVDSELGHHITAHY